MAQIRLERQRQREQEERDSAAQAENDAAIRAKEEKRKAATLFKERKFQEEQASKEAADRKDAARAKRAAAVKHREHTLMCVAAYCRALDLVLFLHLVLRVCWESPFCTVFSGRARERGGSSLTHHHHRRFILYSLR